MPARRYRRQAVAFAMLTLAVALQARSGVADERLRIDAFAVAGGAEITRSREVMLDTRVSGGAEEIRAGEDRRLRDAPWQPYAPATPFRLEAEGEELRTVYVQVRRGAAVSTIESDRIRYLPPTTFYRLPLAAARDLAATRGWRFAAIAANPASTCTLTVDSHEIVLAARQTRPAIDGVCDLVLFGGERKLAQGWRFQQFQRARADLPFCRYRFFEFPVIEGDRLGFRMRILDLRAPADQKQDSEYRRRGCAYAIRSIVLEGPAGRDWQEAFGR